MIIECGKVLIDTDVDYETHKQVISEKTKCHCSEDEPVYWFTQNVNNETRYFHLHYDETGSELRKITSWDEMKPHEKPKKLVKRVKGCPDTCYFTKDKPELEYEMVEEVDYSANTTSKNQMTHWSRKEGRVNNDGILVTPPKKKTWKWWR